MNPLLAFPADEFPILGARHSDLQRCCVRPNIAGLPLRQRCRDCRQVVILDLYQACAHSVTQAAGRKRRAVCCQCGLRYAVLADAAARLLSALDLATTPEA